MTEGVPEGWCIKLTHSAGLHVCGVESQYHLQFDWASKMSFFREGDILSDYTLESPLSKNCLDFKLDI